MTKSSIIKKLAICAFTVAATATLSSFAGQAQAQVTQPGLGAPPLGQRPVAGGPAFNAGPENNLPVGGVGAVIIQPDPSASPTPSPTLPPVVVNPPVVNPPVVNPPVVNPPVVNPPVVNPPVVNPGNQGGGNMGNMGGGNMANNNQEIPEPMTILGTLTAAGFGARFMKKRKQMQASKKEA